jgi:hypothetical protein
LGLARRECAGCAQSGGRIFDGESEEENVVEEKAEGAEQEEKDFEAGKKEAAVEIV